MSRKDNRKDISPFRLHSKQFDKSSVSETVLNDGSIQFHLKGRASTTEKDYDGDIILPEGIDLTRYNQNPVVKKGHLRGVENNIGRSVVTVKEMDGLKGLWIEADVILNPEIESHKEIIHGIRHSLINGWSIGFAKVVVSYDEDLKSKVISSCELHEVSLVDIPNNPMTVRKMIEVAEAKAKEAQEDTLSQETDESDNVDPETTDEAVSDTDSDTSSDDDTGTKSTVVSEYVKEITAESLTVGQMVRYVQTFQYEDWFDGEIYTWDYCNNAEIVKIDAREDATNPELYLLDYKLEIDGREPTTNLFKCELKEIVLVELTPEQLKDCKAVTTKDIADAQEAIETAIEEVGEAVDAVVVAVQEVVEVIAGEEPEISVGNDEEASTKAIQDSTIKSLQDDLDQKAVLIDTQSKQIEEYTKQIAELNSQADESASVLEKLLEDNTKLKTSLEKATSNYKQLGKLYDSEEKETPKPGDLLKSRLIAS